MRFTTATVRASGGSVSTFRSLQINDEGCADLVQARARGISLVLTSPGALDYLDVLVKRVGDNLTLTCQTLGDDVEHDYVWNYLPKNNRSYLIPKISGGHHSRHSNLTLLSLQLNDTGHFICSSPPFSVKKFVLVQNKGHTQCPRGAFSCGAACVLPLYICDGYRDCAGGEDESPEVCGTEQPCRANDKLNCSNGRCVPESSCCGDAPLCRQPSCCEEHRRYAPVPPPSSIEGYVEEYPMLEERRAADDYGFIQSTVYTVTACALIFMIAVVLLVSAVCRMHMKRTALRAAARHCGLHITQTHRFPPCYEASRLLEQEARAVAASQRGQDPSPSSAENSPSHCGRVSETQATGVGMGSRDPSTSCDVVEDTTTATSTAVRPTSFGLGRLADVIFNARYRQVPTQCCDVEMRDVRTGSPLSGGSPTRAGRSSNLCDLNPGEFYFGNPEAAACGRDLNCGMIRGQLTPLERILNRCNSPPDRVPRRSLTLQVGRFQLSFPRIGRRRSSSELGRRPDTPNVSEIDIDELEFVRLNSHETYTLNGRTIRLLGASFENYPAALANSLVGRVTAPPPYSEAMTTAPAKIFGPPPEYLSRENLNDSEDTPPCPSSGDVNGNLQNVAGALEEETQNNVELPPRYEELNQSPDHNANH
ncbi:hypothetical protein EVAR_27363_1 [Eumeta japonica]|uniref:Ig-like domain-containing protein n=1 Tax=Eumeta variegata TaxID=151549 RepID=A0A4C1X560_EUMVA|nr:hypothetical protein EVAR_27363_1 [Eumeta japonica]